MSMPRDDNRTEMVEAWRIFVSSMEKGLVDLENRINQASEMANICTDEWCEATEHYLDDIANALFSISEPRWSDERDTAKIKELKCRVHDLYAEYRRVYKKALAAPVA